MTCWRCRHEFQWSQARRVATEVDLRKLSSTWDPYAAEYDPAVASKADTEVHEGFTCALSGMSPIVGRRYERGFESICHEEYIKLSVKERRQYNDVAVSRFLNAKVPGTTLSTLGPATL